MFKKFNVKPSNKATVGVFSAAGNVGETTLNALSHYFSSSLFIRGIVRNISTDQSLADLRGVHIVEGKFGDKSCKSALEGLDCLFVIPPACEDRFVKTKATLQLAKEANVGHIVTISVTMTRSESSDFGKEFMDLENYVKSLGIPYTILKLPLFMDNLWIVKWTLPKVMLPFQKNKLFNVIAICDVGVAAAYVIGQFGRHKNKIYELSGCQISGEMLVDEFSNILQKDMNFEVMPEDSLSQFLSNIEVQLWQLKAIKNLCKSIENNDSSVCISNTKTNDYKSITNQDYTSLNSWIINSKSYFT